MPASVTISMAAADGSGTEVKVVKPVSLLKVVSSRLSKLAAVINSVELPNDKNNSVVPSSESNNENDVSSPSRVRKLFSNNVSVSIMLSAVALRTSSFPTLKFAPMKTSVASIDPSTTKILSFEPAFAPMITDMPVSTILAESSAVSVTIFPLVNSPMIQSVRESNEMPSIIADEFPTSNVVNELTVPVYALPVPAVTPLPLSAPIVKRSPSRLTEPPNRSKEVPSDAISFTDSLMVPVAVSYTHLTLPTIYSV